MNVIIDVEKLSYATLRLIGQDYNIKGEIITDKFIDNVIDKLEQDTKSLKKN